MGASLAQRRGAIARRVVGTVFVQDTFTGASGSGLPAHTGETGATWTNHPSYNTGATTWAITNANRARSANSSSCLYASGTPTTAEYDVEAVFNCITNVGGEGIVGRVDVAANTMYLVHRADATTWTLFKGVAGTFTSLGTFTQSLTVAQDYAVKLEIRDAAKKVFIDGVERISSADNAITAAGRVGVRGFQAHADTAGVHLDSLTATNA